VREGLIPSLESDSGLAKSRSGEVGLERVQRFGRAHGVSCEIGSWEARGEGGT